MFKDKILEISLGFIALLVITGIVAINFILDDGSKPTYTSNPPTTKVTNISTDPTELSLDTIFINIRSSKYKIFKADIAFKMKNERDKKALDKNMENVRNALLQYLATMDANNLDTVKGKEQLKLDLIDMMESSFGYKIETIYFKNIILSP